MFLIAILKLFLSSFIAVNSANIEIPGNFMECQTDVLHNHLQFDENCYSDEITPNKQVTLGSSKNVTVLSKREYYLEAIGFECSIKKSKITYIQDFFLNKYEAGPIVEIIQLTRLECLALITDQLCNKFPMNCKSNQTCHYVERPEVDYPFWTGKNTHVYYECQFNQKMVVASTKSSIVIHDAVRPCYPKDGVCILPTTTVIWETDLLRECPYENILEISMMYPKLLENGHHVLYSIYDNYLFELVEDVSNECGFNLSTTTQGLYLVIEPNEQEKRALKKLPVSKLKMEHFQDKDYRDLILAETDFKMMLFKKEIYKLECSVMMNAIRTHLDEDDTFIKINYLGEKDIILYINNGQAYVPLCANVTTIIIEEDENENIFLKGFGIAKKCFKDLKIKYRSNLNETNTGFLRNSEIITKSSKKILCTNTDETKEIIIQNKFKLSKKLNKIVVSNYTSSVTKLKTRNNNLKNLFNHHSFLTNGTDLISNLDDFLEINNDIGKFSNKESIDESTFGQRLESESKQGGYFDNLFQAIGDFFTEIFTAAKNILIIIIMAIIGYFLLKILFKCLPCCFSCIKLIYNKTKKQENNHHENNDEELA